LQFINKFVPVSNVVIADKNYIDNIAIPYISENELITNLDKFDIIIKSPGISLYNLNIKKQITSQAK